MKFILEKNTIRPMSRNAFHIIMDNIKLTTQRNASAFTDNSLFYLNANKAYFSKLS